MEMVKVSYIHASSAVRCEFGSSEDKDLELYTHRRPSVKVGGIKRPGFDVLRARH